MTGRTHDAIAFASLVTIATFNPPESLTLMTAATAVVGNIIGSTLPDLDQASNRLYDLLPWGDHLGKIFRRVFLGHRTLSHSIIGFIIIFYLIRLLLYNLLNPNFVNIDIVYDAMLIGYLSHLAGDAITKEGLPLFFPLKFKIGFPPIETMRITTGKFIENFVILPGSAAYLFWFFGKYQNEVINLVRLLQTSN